eukprot:CAMPEP_0118940116 /NCGR_PEP_ID=MMETSP1169-20130426/30628_1 /TAXON_ID=36882 /ORGANISM="Pyramimonas obovata, Strain CCMP722" /LENGTH=433 /DNA_ID=CAMNT_0006884519 /DNA_START=94 /DNA_END=1391 /DNA_ORIENTATION=+
MGRAIVGKAMLRRSKLGSKSSFMYSQWNLVLIIAYIAFIALVLVAVPRHNSSNSAVAPSRVPQNEFSEHHWTDSRKAGKFQRIVTPAIGKEEPYEHVGHTMDQRLETCLKGSHEAKDDEAYVTFLTGNQGGYVSGVLALNHSLVSAGSTRPLVVIHISDVPEEELNFLHQAGIKTIAIPSLPNPNCHGDSGRACKRGRDNYSKLNLFGLTQYRTLVFMDCDMTIRSNIDELFCFDTFAVSKIFNCHPVESKNCQNLNSGIMVIKPNKELFDDMMSKYPTMYSYNGGDQGFLTTYYEHKPKTFINNRMYNVKVKIRDKRPCTPDIASALADKTVSLNVAKVLHFMDDVKPWVHLIGRRRKAAFDNGTECFRYGMGAWRRHFDAVMDAVPGLERYLVEQRERQAAERPDARQQASRFDLVKPGNPGIPPHVRMRG